MQLTPTPTRRRAPEIDTAPLSPRESYAALGVDGQLVVVGGARGDRVAGPVTAAVYDSATNKWRALPEQWRLPHFASATLAGREILAIGSRVECDEPTSICQSFSKRAVAVDLTRDTVREMTIPTVVATEPGGFVAGGPNVALWLSTGKLAGLHRYDTVRDHWEERAAPPCAPASGYTAGFRPTWTGDRLLFSCDDNVVASYSALTDPTPPPPTARPTRLNRSECRAVRGSGR